MLKTYMPYFEVEMLQPTWGGSKVDIVMIINKFSVGVQGISRLCSIMKTFQKRHKRCFIKMMRDCPPRELEKCLNPRDSQFALFSSQVKVCLGPNKSAHFDVDFKTQKYK